MVVFGKHDYLVRQDEALGLAVSEKTVEIQDSLVYFSSGEIGGVELTLGEVGTGEIAVVEDDFGQIRMREID